MGNLIKIQDIEQFREIVNVPSKTITPQVLEGTKELDEKETIEPMLRLLLGDHADTPHGPTEIADILTTKVTLRGIQSLAAFVVKGKSFQKVRSTNTTYQLVRLRKVPQLNLIVLIAVGSVQDDLKTDFLQIAKDADCNYLIVDATDLARLFIAYGLVCPKDGTPYSELGTCEHGHEKDPGTKVEFFVAGATEYEIYKLRDVSLIGARRLTAELLVDKNYGREALRQVITDAIEEVRKSTYCRNSQTAQRWKNSQSNAVFLFLAGDSQDVYNCNWIARAQWIDPNLAPVMRPNPILADEYIGDIGIIWEKSYRWKRNYYKNHTMGKGEAVAILEPLVKKALKIYNQMSSWFDEFEKGTISEDTLVQRVRSVATQVSTLIKESGNLPLPPLEMRDYDSHARNIFIWLDNITIYYSDNDMKSRTEKNRTFLAQKALADIQSEWTWLDFEQKKWR